MSFFSKLRGTIEGLFQIGKDGAQLKDSGTDELHLRNSDDSAFARLKVSTPVDDLDAVNKIYADSIAKPIIIKEQIDTSVSIPNNTAVRRFLVVTTAGSGANIGDLLYDDGSNTGVMQILTAVEGRTIAVTDTLSGGTITLQADSIYIWDADGGAWLKVGDVGAVSGAVRTIRFPIDNTAGAQDSVEQIPANAIIHDCQIIITTSYSGGATLQVGRSSDPDLLQVVSDNKPQAVAPSTYSVPQDTPWGGTPAVVRVTAGGTLTAGAGFCKVMYSIPDV
jgi:hypothetical protein